MFVLMLMFMSVCVQNITMMLTLIWHDDLQHNVHVTLTKAGIAHKSCWDVCDSQLCVQQVDGLVHCLHRRRFGCSLNLWDERVSAGQQQQSV